MRYDLKAWELRDREARFSFAGDTRQSRHRMTGPLGTSVALQMTAESDRVRLYSIPPIAGDPGSLGIHPLTRWQSITGSPGPCACSAPLTFRWEAPAP
jgi:hypothetical protein